ncbi:IQ-DOMAIN 1 [Olea europaea subsp. europaea]|uniref:IQ-DOMAIN 1 n=1 Tax=Olea europaea subsp. europaea TaxID=158383 RepID=A0A8S0V065_OLEEU|nr:IQ-DOMAIN 1 [Olea europaea subsp. europaea]
MVLYELVQSAPKKSNGCKGKNHSAEVPGNLANGISTKNKQLTEDDAARQIQKAFKAYIARKRLPRLKGIGRIQDVVDGIAVKNQTSSALSHIHFWSKIQAEIRSRWISMVTEGRMKQKKLENQLKLEAKLHEVEVEWCGGSETMEEILNRIQQREEAAARRERAMAYAFSHQARHLKRRFITIINCDYHYIALSIGNDSVNFLQWRANSSQYLGQTYYDLSKDNCGWSWKERWIAVRPWEKRVEVSSTMPKKVGSKQKTSKTTNLAKTNIIVSVKPHLSNGKDPTHARKNSSQTIMKQASPDANLE